MISFQKQKNSKNVKMNGTEYLLQITEKRAVLIHVDYGVRELEIPDKVVYKGEEYLVCGIDGNAVGSNSLIETVTVPGSVKGLPPGCFRGCRSLKKVVLGEGLKYIKKDAFRDCTFLEEVVLPSTVMIIGQRAF